MNRHAKAIVAISALLSIVVFGATLARAAAPVVTIDPVDPSKARYTTAHVSGKVDPGDQFTFWSFETSTDGGASWSGFAFHGAFDGATEPGTHDVDFDLTGLQPGTPYEVRLVATNFSDPEAISSVETFTTEAVQAPDVTIDPVAGITPSTADFSGTVDPNAPKDASETDEAEEGAFQSSWHFDCVPDCGNLSGEPVAADDDPAPVSAQATGLKPNTEYTVTLHASNAGGTGEASETFTTEAAAPAIDSLKVEDVTSEKATLKANVNPGGVATSYRFEWVTEAEFEAGGFADADKAPVPDASAGSGKAAVAISETIGGLDPGTKYRFRVVATNVVDTTESPAKAFKTLALPKAPPQGAFPGQGFLPDNRAWELVSPPNKLGNDIQVSTTRIRAAADGSAVAFLSHGGFADAVGTNIDTEYISRRTAAPGANGWATHAITPPQEPLSLFAGAFHGVRAQYIGEFSPDLRQGVFKAWSPLTAAPNVAEIPHNLYLRKDLRTPGAGSYRLLSDAADPLSPPALTGTPSRTHFADADADFEHLIFNAELPLRAAAEGNGTKLYKSDGPGPSRLVAVGPNCPAAGNDSTGVNVADKPCSVAPHGILQYTHRTISADGSRVQFITPVQAREGIRSTTAGATSRLFQLDDRGTTASADDAIVQVSASEKAVPQFTQPAQFGTAGTDGERVFFFSGEQLTEAPGFGLYLWERQAEDEVQQVSVDAEGGTFSLTAHTQPTLGRGNLTEGSTEVSEVDAGSFLIGQTVSGPGIPPGTTIVGMGDFFNFNQSFLTLSDPATETASGVEIAANVVASTPPLPFDASAAAVESALGALADPEGRRLLGEGNVEVTGGPGAADPYEIAFTGALEGVNVLELGAEGSDLSGGAATADVATTNPVQNLTLLVAMSVDGSGGVIGASEDGHRLYFTAAGQLVPGGPTDRGLYYWQDADGTPGGTLSVVGGVHGGDLDSLASPLTPFGALPRAARITPDGRRLFFSASVGSGLALGYDHGPPPCPVGNANGNTNGGCSELYLYRAETSTPTQPDLLCASCNPSGAPATTSAWINRNVGIGASGPDSHLIHALSDDARYAFFSTAEKLVPEDINGVEDAYLYDTTTEEPRLLSSGESSSPSYFADASADGKTAFILTRERLSGWDFDGNTDLYAARAGGGLPEPPPAPPSCQGDACQPAPATLNRSTPGSATVTGPGNETRQPPRRCAKGRRKVKARNGKTRCVKRKGNRRRAASPNRRQGR